MTMKVELVDHMGSDLSVVNAARVSMDKESEWEKTYQGEWIKEVERLNPGDTKLISYLAKHKHWTPFAHTAISLRIKAPIFVARQLGKHQVGLVWNEVSRRYVDNTPEMYHTEVWRKKADNVKQGSSEERLRFMEYGDREEDISRVLDQHNVDSVELYLDMLEAGVCPEQARMVLPQSMMTEWIWTGNLVALANMCKLRLDSHTQRETQEVAKMVNDIIQPLFPVSWKELMSCT